MARRVLSIEYLPLASLQLDPQNPRLHDRKQLRQLASSLKSFGFNVPVLVDAQSRVIAGHGRFRASQLLGMAEVPTIRLEHLSEHQATGRACYGIVLDPPYIDTIVRRWQAFTRQSAVQESTDRTFNEIEEENNGRAE